MNRVRNKMKRSYFISSATTDELIACSTSIKRRCEDSILIFVQLQPTRPILTPHIALRLNDDGNIEQKVIVERDRELAHVLENNISKWRNRFF